MFVEMLRGLIYSEGGPGGVTPPQVCYSADPPDPHGFTGDLYPNVNRFSGRTRQFSVSIFMKRKRSDSLKITDNLLETVR